MTASHLYYPICTDTYSSYNGRKENEARTEFTSERLSISHLVIMDDLKLSVKD